MARPYTQDLRDRVMAARDGGMQTKAVALTFKVSPAWVRRIMQARREEARTTPRPMGGARVGKVDLERLRELVRAQPDATIAELHGRLGGAGAGRCGASAVAMALGRLDLTYKKRPCTRPSSGGRTSPSGGTRGVGSSRRGPRRA